MATQYLNEKKFQRAVDLLRKENKPVTDEAVLALYLKWGGAIAGDPSTYRGVPDMTNQEKSMLDFIGREAGINVEGLTLKDVIKKAAEAFKKKK